MRDLLSKNALGRIHEISIEFRHDFLSSPMTGSAWRHAKQLAGAGALGDLGVHAIDLLLWLSNEDVELASATGSIQYAVRSQSDGSKIKAETDDTANLALKLKQSGGVGNILVSRVATGLAQLRFTIFGTKSGLILEIDPNSGAANFSHAPIEITALSSTSHQSIYSAIISGQTSNLASFNDGMNAQLILDEALRYIEASS
ncbi:Gfo/Idh/MocA family protein [Pseudovibrio denitrificans]|uniref:Gfo/Idh/MocA family protein n=1 Tax=Pseudovibrio denitrificans TaxID=258256 RepID=UPI0039BFF9E7